jgi:hypothetical protein
MGKVWMLLLIGIMLFGFIGPEVKAQQIIHEVASSWTTF